MINELIERGFTRHQLAKGAVAEAMMVAQAGLLGGLCFLSEGDFDDVLEFASRGFCRIASARALEYLATHFMEGPNKLFTKACLVVAYNNSSIPFVEKYKDDNFSSYFLVQDIEGYWHAASPANYERDDPKTSMLHPIEPSQDLSLVLASMQQNDGGDWPDETAVENAFRMCCYRPYKTLGEIDGNLEELLMVMEVFKLNGRPGIISEAGVPLQGY